MAVHTIESAEQLKAIAHPLRRTILEALVQEPATAKQIAITLGERPSRLYHHVDALARAGLIELVRTRPVRGSVEKYYRAIADSFVVDHGLLRTDPDEASDAPSLRLRENVRVTAGDIRRLRKILEKWQRKCNEKARDNGDRGDLAVLSVELFPKRGGS